MRRTHRSTVTCAIVVSGLGLVLGQPASGLAGEPSGRLTARPTPPGASVFTHTGVVRLITGDRVRVLTRADGTTVSSILPGSPHAGAPVARWATAHHSYLLPRTGTVERERLDVSLFDVAALGSFRGGRVPIVVRFASGARTSPLPGLRLDLAAARASAHPAVVRGSYAPDFAGLGRRALSRIASVRLAVPQTQTQPQPQPRATTTTTTPALTIHVARASGGPSRQTTVLIENVDDSDLFLATPSTDDSGNVTVDVPAGHYSALAFTFTKVVVAPEFDVTADRTVPLDLGDATVKPHVALSGYRVVDTALSVGRSPDRGFSFPLTFDGPHFFMRVQPTSPHVRHGAIHTGVSATMVPSNVRHPASYDHLAVTGDVSRGVPDDLTFDLHRRDFARVVDRWYADGPSALRPTLFGVSGSGFTADLFTGQEYDARVPGRRVVLFQSAPDVYYQQTLFPQATPDVSADLTQLITVRRYRTPGSTPPVSWAHGPVGPGVEGPRASFFHLIRRHGTIQGYLPLFDGAGSAMISFAESRDAQWSVRRGSRLLASGGGDIGIPVPVPARRHAYTLTAVSHPVSPGWTLSTRVRDQWDFRSRAGEHKVPTLMPSYVPPTALDGSLRPGPTSFRLSFSGFGSQSHRIATARLLLSTNDGQRWRAARIVRTSPTSFRVSYRNPGAGAAHFMSLRVAATDSRGNAVTETAIRVYHLR